MEKRNKMRILILGCCVIGLSTVAALAGERVSKSKKMRGVIKFKEDFGNEKVWYRWGSPRGWYCASSSIPGIKGGIASISHTPKGMSGAYLECGYKKAYPNPLLARFLPNNMILSDKGIVTMELTVEICGKQASPNPFFGLSSGAKIKNIDNQAHARTGGPKDYLDCDLNTKKASFFGVKLQWHATHIKKETVNRLVMQAKTKRFGEEYVDDQHYLRPGGVYRVRFRMDFGTDKISLDLKTYKGGKWGEYEQVFDWKPAGLDLSQQGINALVLSPAGTANNFVKFDDLLFSFVSSK